MLLANLVKFVIFLFIIFKQLFEMYRRFKDAM